MADEQQIQENVDWTYVEFDRRLFVEEILNVEFDGNIGDCAKAMDMSTMYLHELIYNTSKKAGKINLTRIFRYCIKTGKDPLRYITKIIK
jgi:hypothetical protein